MTGFSEWTRASAASSIEIPTKSDDKYSRGVLGVITGSDQYPGAAVLGVEAALKTGVGMVRYLGPDRASDLVLRQRPEAVTVPGRVAAWLVGSGMPSSQGDLGAVTEALGQGVPVVLDAGAMNLYPRSTGPAVITPHYRELALLLSVDPEPIARDPGHWALRASRELGVTVLLKGNTTFVAGPEIALKVSNAPTWLATAGAGDALAGILGALVATHAKAALDDPTELASLAATATLIHSAAAAVASGGGPLTIMELCARVPETIAALLAR